MQALVKSPMSFAVRSKSILSEYCRCQNLKRTPFILCSEGASRFIGTLGCNDHFSNGVKLNSSDIDSFNVLPYARLIPVRRFSLSVTRCDKEPLKPSSKVEETVKVIKEKAEEAKSSAFAPEVQAKKLPLLTRVWHEVVHYYHGFRLLFIDINVSRKLIWRVLNGKTLSRREHKLLVRTVGDVFRLLPFSVFIIVPFMELLLPLAIKLFPGMLPSTFQTATERDGKLKQSLKVRLEMAKFLQTTLDEMSVQSKSKGARTALEFTNFFRKVRTTGEAATTEEILKFSKLFEDEITLDSLSRQQLTALCRVLDINTVGMTSLLRFQIRMKLRSLVADDKLIQKEGLETLTITELQQACQARGMRAYGVSEEKLRAQLKQWLDLSLNEKVPPSLLLLSRALMLPEGSTSDQLKATISALPDAVELKAAAAINEREGVIDNKTKIQLIKEEELRIKEERAELREAKMRASEVEKEVLVDSAPIIGVSPLAAEKKDKLSSTDIEALEDALDTLGQEKKTLLVEKKDKLSSTDIEALEDALDTLGQEKKTLLVEKEELDDLKEELEQYKEDVQELNQVLVDTDSKEKIQETKAAQNLYKKVNNMISKMDTVLADLEKKSKQLAPEDGKAKPEEVVRIDELMDVIKRIQKVPDEARLAQISDVLGKIDDDCDGAITVEEVLKVIELIGKENVQLSTKQLDEILQLLEKEETLELENQIEKALERSSNEAKTAIEGKDQKEKNEINLSDSPNEKPLVSHKHAMSVKPNGSTSTTITEPKNGETKQL